MLGRPDSSPPVPAGAGARAASAVPVRAAEARDRPPESSPAVWKSARKVHIRKISAMHFPGAPDGLGRNRKVARQAGCAPRRCGDSRMGHALQHSCCATPGAFPRHPTRPPRSPPGKALRGPGVSGLFPGRARPGGLMRSRPSSFSLGARRRIPGRIPGFSEDRTRPGPFALPIPRPLGGSAGSFRILLPPKSRRCSRRKVQSLREWLSGNRRVLAGSSRATSRPLPGAGQGLPRGPGQAEARVLPWPRRMSSPGGEGGGRGWGSERHPSRRNENRPVGHSPAAQLIRGATDPLRNTPARATPT